MEIYLLVTSDMYGKLNNITPCVNELEARMVMLRNMNDCLKYYNYDLNNDSEMYNVGDYSFEVYTPDGFTEWNEIRTLKMEIK